MLAFFIGNRLDINLDKSIKIWKKYIHFILKFVKENEQKNESIKLSVFMAKY